MGCIQPTLARLHTAGIPLGRALEKDWKNIGTYLPHFQNNTHTVGFELVNNMPTYM